MTATAHALIGAAIATKLGDPFYAVPLAFASHFVFDKLPHWDPMTNGKTKSNKRIVVESGFDVLVSFGLVTLFFPFPLAYLCAFAAQLPDWLELPYLFLKNKFFVFEWNYKLQKWVHDIGFNARLSAPWGVITQIIVVLIFLFWSLK